jgi:Spore germination B3/ GerAC like, C-terminal.
MSMDEFKDEIAKLVAKKIEDDVKKVVQIVQNDYESDVFGFGRIVHIQNKKEWKEKITGNWEKIYPSVPVHISVKANINSSTLNQIPNTDFKSRGE